MNYEETLALMEGQNLFEQGDPGGDLFLIQTGEIEIYRTNGTDEVRLTTMGNGEVIGIMTCMTNEPRMASARATSETVVKRIKHEKIKTLIGNLPPWMKIILKDFTLRLNQMNKSFSSSTVTIRELKINQITKIYTAVQLASAFSNSADLLKVNIDETSAVYIEDALEHFALVLNRPEEELSAIFAIFIDAGMVKSQINSSNKKTYVAVTNCKSLNNFCAWVAISDKGKTKKLLKVKFSNKEFRILTGLVRFARKLDLNLKTEVTISVKDLKKSMEKAVGQKFELESTIQAAKVKLIETAGEGINAKISFIPIELSRTITHLIIYKKLSKLQMKADLEHSKKYGVA